ncbi:MAG: transposase, partial [Methylococcaceae bacterium]
MGTLLQLIHFNPNRHNPNGQKPLPHNRTGQAALYDLPVLEWLPVFTRPETFNIIVDSWRYQRQHAGLKLYGYVILENHLHFIAQAPDLRKCVDSFKSYTARQLLDYLQAQRATRLLDRLQFAKRAHKTDREFQFWQEGVHAELVFSEAMMQEKLDYIHNNPVQRGYVNLP